MRGKGRPVVIALTCLCALVIILDYYGEIHDDSRETGSEALLSVPDTLEETLMTAEENLSAGFTDASPEKDKDIWMGIAGDICLDEHSPVMRHMRKKGGGIAGCIEPRLLRRMNKNDLMILNNEFSISDRGKPMKGKAYTFCAPTKNTAMLKKLGVDAVSLANNHVFDYGEAAFLDTLSSLKRAGIEYMGGGKNIQEAKRPLYFKCKGKVIAIVAATRAEKYVLTPRAKRNSPGVFRTYDDREYVKAIGRADKKADVVIAFVHWGTEYSTVLETAQRQQAKDYINAGADVVVGAHTHCMQGVGYYKGKPIFYSLGNFWFNEKTLYTTLLQLHVKEDGTVQAKMLPCIQAGKETKLLTGRKRVKKFVKHINRISENGRLDKNGNVYRREK